MRKYYIDWLRILLIVSVFFYHVGMLFNTWGWHIKNNELSDNLNWFMIFLHTWRMPLLFFISGAGTFFALGKRSKGEYVGERANRLLIPLAFGMLIIVPPQVYVEKINQYDSYLHFYSNLFNGPYPEGNTSWHHLWFVCYLFVISVFAIPIISFFKSKSGQKVHIRLEKLFRTKGSFAIVLIPLILSQAILSPYFPNETHALIDDWAFFTYCFIYFISGYVLLSSDKIANELEKQRLLHLTITIIATVLLFTVPQHMNSQETGKIVWGIFKIMVGWFCSLTALGFGKKHLSFDNALRARLNEAIYPFYILHQTVIVVSAYFIVDLNAEIWIKYTAMSIWGLAVSVLIYRYLIRPYNLLRFAFGMKPKAHRRTAKNPEPELVTISTKKERMVS